MTWCEDPRLAKKKQCDDRNKRDQNIEKIVFEAEFAFGRKFRIIMQFFMEALYGFQKLHPHFPIEKCCPIRKKGKKYSDSNILKISCRGLTSTK